MASAEFHEILKISKSALFSTVTAYEHYPVFVEGCKAVKVYPRDSRGAVRVDYQAEVMSKVVNYTLDHFEDQNQGTVSWTLIESNFFKKNEGGWQIREVSQEKSDVKYWVDAEFTMPGFILSRLIKSGLPKMVKSFEEKAKKGAV
jgi:coenzyme Q-binding protein COQ10